MAKKRKPSNPAAHKRTKPSRVSAAILKKYRYLFGGKISPAAMKLIEKEYAKNPGGPGAFERCVKAVAARGEAYSPAGVCASQGRKKYGAKKFAAMARAGKKKAAAKKRNPSYGRPFARKKVAGGYAIVDRRTGSTVRTVKTKPAAIQVVASLNGKTGRAVLQNSGKKRRSNPDEQAAERYEYFHGRKPETVTTVSEKIREHGVLSGIGKLASLVVLAVDGRTKVTLGKFRGALLAQNEKGNQLFIRGGNQSVNLADFGIKGAHENELLGAGVEVAYHTQKDHLTPETGGKGIYHHVFGKGGSRLPVVLYDVRNKLLHFAGGGYTLPEVGIHG